tara:strand:- start:900 stop:1397 length:498 start_codon:yes stop_codon:yes gene_type:complete
MLNPLLYRAAICKISERLQAPRNLPTIDCFAARKNTQATVGCMYIDSQRNFFTRKFDCNALWRYSVAWAHPPCEARILCRTIDAFARRHIRGYICGPQWPGHATENSWLLYAREQSGYKTEVDIGGRGERDVYLLESFGYRTGGGETCRVDFIVVYFDFRNAYNE